MPVRLTLLLVLLLAMLSGSPAYALAPAVPVDSAKKTERSPKARPEFLLDRIAKARAARAQLRKAKHPIPKYLRGLRLLRVGGILFFGGGLLTVFTLSALSNSLSFLLWLVLLAAGVGLLITGGIMALVGLALYMHYN